MDLDHKSFNAEQYVDGLLRDKNMRYSPQLSLFSVEVRASQLMCEVSCVCRDLLDFDQKILAAKRALDNDMQMLVYENYNKVFNHSLLSCVACVMLSLAFALQFISATDMIRKMKDNVESMEDEMKVCDD